MVLTIIFVKLVAFTDIYVSGNYPNFLSKFSRDEKNLRILFYKRGETNFEKSILLKLRGIIYSEYR